MGDIFKGNFGFDFGSESQSGTRTTQKVLSQQGIDKIIYDIMSSDKGLAALATAENASGGYRSSTKPLLAQDLVAKIAGEIANITAPTVETSQSSSSKKGAKLGTVICTALMLEGYLDKQLYADGAAYYHKLHPRVIEGYQRWAIPSVEIIQKRSWLMKLIAPIATSRYKMITGRGFGILGAITIYIGEPICWLISFLPSMKQEEKVYG